MIRSKHPVIATVPVTDLMAAMRFYQEQLGLAVCDQNPDRRQVIFEAGNGSHFLLYESPIPPSSDATVLNFLVNDLESTMDDLRRQGIPFEEYDLPHVKTRKGISETDGERVA